ncbi:MAG: type III secretion protein, partial [Calditrichaeota bacterium]
GRIIGNQMGLGIAELIDPESGAQASPVGNFYSLTAILLFLILNGHHFIIAAIYETFRFIPLNTNSFISTLAIKQLLLAFNELFKIAIKIAAPALVTLFIIEVCMGIMARLVPQMNIFFIGLPVRLGIGLFILIASLPIFNLLLESFIKLWQRDLISLIKII